MSAAVYTPEHSDEQGIVRAMTDRWRLATRAGCERRDGEYERRHPDVVRPFVADIGRRRRILPGSIRVNLAIRPKSAKRRRR